MPNIAITENVALPSGEPNYGILNTIPEQDIIECVSSGMSLRTIAAKFGCSGQALHQYIEKRPHIKAAQLVGYSSRMEIREEQLETATEQVDISRTRELLGHARWLAERGDPARWGQKQNAMINIDLGSALQLLSERIQERSQTVVSAPTERSLTLNVSNEHEK